MQSLKYRVFCDLWRKGYYLTNGLKYGGDYLVYPGTVYQASYIYKGWSFLYRYKNYSLVPRLSLLRRVSGESLGTRLQKLCNCMG